MALSKFVKISKVDNLSDARYCAGMMVDMLGFNAVPDTAKYVGPRLFSDITEWISGVHLVGEFGGMAADDIKLQAHDYQFDYLETHLTENLEPLKNLGQKLILRIPERLSGDALSKTLRYCQGLVEYCIFPVAWDGLEDQLNAIKKTEDLPPLIKGLSSAGSVSDIDPVWNGIEMEGTAEDRPGYTDYGEVMEVLEALEVD